MPVQLKALLIRITANCCLDAINVNQRKLK